MRGHGLLRVAHGGNAAARLIARVFMLPPAGDAVETRLVVTPGPGGDDWRRTFGHRAMNSRQYPAADGSVAERIGPLELRFRLEPSGAGTTWRQTGAALALWRARLPLPRWCAPRVFAREDRRGADRIGIDVRVELPVVGPILSYAGTIRLEEASERAQRREPRERSAPAERRARECVGESEGRSPSDEI